MACIAMNDDIGSAGSKAGKPGGGVGGRGKLLNGFM
jgi:hypothetical protein